MGFVLSLAKELQRRRSRVNAIAPTAWTRLVSAIPDKVLEAHIGADGLARLQAQRPEHIAPLVCFLASDASVGISGQIFRSAGSNLGLVGHPRTRLSAAADGSWTAESIAQTVAGWRSELESLSGLGEL